VTKRLHDKYFVRRNDGRDHPGGDREGAEYFVLDLTHDTMHALSALYAYIESLRWDEESPELVNDLEELAERVRRESGL
jgi:hypothetical protein